MSPTRSRRRAEAMNRSDRAGRQDRTIASRRLRSPRPGCRDDRIHHEGIVRQRCAWRILLGESTSAAFGVGGVSVAAGSTRFRKRAARTAPDESDSGRAFSGTTTACQVGGRSGSALHQHRQSRRRRPDCSSGARIVAVERVVASQSTAGQPLPRRSACLLALLRSSRSRRLD